VKVIWEGNETFYRSEKDFSLNVSVESGYTLYLFIVAFLIVVFTTIVFFTRKLKTKQAEIFGEKDESLVISLLSSHGGALSQNDIRRMTGFSKSKTSIIIKSLEAKGKIKKRKVGRENMIYLVS
jgi:DNA-binding MarR family transcriptional regulator